MDRPDWRSASVWLATMMTLLLAPLLLDGALARQMLCQMAVASVVCLSYQFLLGQGGMLSFGHAVFTGAGAYAVIHTLRAIGDGTLPLPVSLVPLAGGLAGLLLALPLGWLATRRPGTPLAMITLGLGELVWVLAQMLPDWSGGQAGITANRVVGPQPWGLSFGPTIELYYLLLAWALLSLLLLRGLEHAPLGQALRAVRDNPARAASLGIDPHRVRWLTFAAAGGLAGIGGGMAALVFEIVQPDALGAQRSAAILLFTFLGGIGHWLGAIAGAVLMVLAQVWLSELTRAWLLYLGLAFMLMLLWAPGGLAGWLAGQWALLRAGRWRRESALADPWRCAAALALLAGLVLLVELAYARQMAGTVGTGLRVAGVALDAARPGPWLASVALLALGTALACRAACRGRGHG